MPSRGPKATRPFDRVVVGQRDERAAVEAVLDLLALGRDDVSRRERRAPVRLAEVERTSMRALVRRKTALEE
jgi:hypothetical protein